MIDPKTEYTEKLAAMSDEEFVKATETACWHSAFASNSPRAQAHWQTDLCYDEARRREKLWLYSQGRNDAMRSAGHEPSEHDLAAARPPAAVPQP